MKGRKSINNQIMSYKHKYLIVGENDQHRMQFVNKINNMQRVSIQIANQSPINRTVISSDKIQSIGDYPIKCLDEIKDENNISGIIVLINKQDMRSLTSLSCVTLSDHLTKIIKIYCSKLDLQNENIQDQPKLILASAQEHDYRSNNDIISNIKQYLSEQVRTQITQSNDKKHYQHLIIDKLGQWKILATQSTEINAKLILSQLQKCAFDSTQSQILENDQNMDTIIEHQRSMAQQFCNQNNSVITQSEQKQINKQRPLRRRLVEKQIVKEKKTCCCNLI